LWCGEAPRTKLSHYDVGRYFHPRSKLKTEQFADNEKARDDGVCYRRCSGRPGRHHSRSHRDDRVCYTGVALAVLAGIVLGVIVTTVCATGVALAVLAGIILGVIVGSFLMLIVFVVKHRYETSDPLFPTTEFREVAATGRRLVCSIALRCSCVSACMIKIQVMDGLG